MFTYSIIRFICIYYKTDSQIHIEKKRKIKAKYSQRMFHKCVFIL